MRGKYKRKKQRQQALAQVKAPIAPRIDQKIAAEPKGTKERENKEEEPVGFVKLWKEDIKFRVEVCAVVVGFGVLVVYAFQLCAMLTANRNTTEQFMLENRPWLGFEILGPPPDIKGRVTVLMKNNGKTPATHTTDIDARTRVITGEREIEAFWNQWKSEVFPVRPNPTNVVSPNTSGQTVSTPDGDYASQRSDQILIVYGRVDYSGAYAKGEHYWTEFCFAYNPKIPTASPWSPCIYHNEMQ